MPSGNEHNPPEPTLTHLRTLRDRLASDRPCEQQDALREVLASAAHRKVIAFSTAARLEELGWPAVGSDVAAVRLAVADLVVCVCWEALWPPSEEMIKEEDDGSAESSPSPATDG